MRLKIKFEKGNRPFPSSTQDAILGYINSILGENNSYHGKFSDYNVSDLQGEKTIDDEHRIIYPNGSHIYISSPNMEFLTKFLMDGHKYQLNDMNVKSIEVEPIHVNSNYDIIRTYSPILIKKDDKQITFEDDDFIQILTDKSRKKLIHNGISLSDANTLTLELFHPENAKVQKRRVHNLVNVGSHVMLLVKGKPNVRKKLYQLGLGYCTGCGFGFVNVKQ